MVSGGSPHKPVPHPPASALNKGDQNPEECVALGDGQRYESIHMMAKRLRNQGVSKADARQIIRTAFAD